MKAVIMAGGDGKRLRPLTCTMPKPMVPLLNKPVIGYCVELLKAHGFDDITVTLRYLPNVVKRYLGNGSDWGTRIACVTEEIPLGTAGGVRHAAQGCEETLLVISGDAMTDINLTAAYESHKRSGAGATILLKKVKAPMEFGVILRDKEGYITRFIEKPSASEVFSDLVNTGIYFLEPFILDMIPEEGAYDFSNDLFPRLMRTGIRIFGHMADGYWSDIGDTAQYVATQADMLDGKCRFFTAAKLLRDGVYAEEGTRISERAVITSPCYVGKDAEIAANVYFGAYSVACTGVRIGPRCSVKRSILLPNTRLREGVELRGALLCENAQAGEDSAVFERAVVGASCDIGKRAVIGRGVQVWPCKQLEGDREYEDNVVWESDCSCGCQTEPEHGHADRELTPERAARIGAAFAATMKAPAELAVATDGAQQCVMLKHALMAGIASQGVDVWDMGTCPGSALRFAIRSLALEGGIFIQKCGEHEVRMILCDALGLTLTNSARRGFVNQFQQGELRPVTCKRLGVIQKHTGIAKSFEASLRRLLRPRKEFSSRLNVLIGGNRSFYDTLLPVLMQEGIDVRYTQEQEESKLHGIMGRVKAGICFFFDEDHCLCAITGEKRLPGAEVTALLAAAAAKKGRKTIVIPADLPEELCEMIRLNGAETVKASQNAARMEHLAMEKDAWLPELYEPEAAAVRLCALMRENELDTLLENLPHIERAQSEVKCSWREIGRVLRNLVENSKEDDLELIDGVRITTDEGWVLVKPNRDLTACRFAAQSFREEYAKDLADLYAERVRAILDEEEKDKA